MRRILFALFFFLLAWAAPATELTPALVAGTDLFSARLTSTSTTILATLHASDASALEILQVRFHETTRAPATTVTIAIKSSSAPYDAILSQTVLANAADVNYIPVMPIVVKKSEAVKVTGTLSASKAYGIEVIYRVR